MRYHSTDPNAQNLCANVIHIIDDEKNDDLVDALTKIIDGIKRWFNVIMKRNTKSSSNTTKENIKDIEQ